VLLSNECQQSAADELHRAVVVVVVVVVVV